MSGSLSGKVFVHFSAIQWRVRSLQEEQTGQFDVSAEGLAGRERSKERQECPSSKRISGMSSLSQRIGFRRSPERTLTRERTARFGLI